MNAVRQYMAIAILTYAYSFLKKKKNVKYIICVITAMLFHTSAIIALAIPIFNYIYKNKKINKVLIGLYFLSIIFIFIDISSVINLFKFILPDRYDYYINSVFAVEKNMSAIIKIILPNILLLISYLYKDKIEKKYTDFNYVLIAWYLYVLISNCFYGINIFIRLGWYFEYFILLLVPMLVSYFKNNTFKIGNIEIKKFNLIITVVVIFTYLSMTIISIFINGGHGVVPYNTIFTLLF